MKFRFSVARAVLLGTMLVGALALSGEAERPAAAQSAPALKIAVVDLNQALNEVEEGKAAISSLEKRFAEKKALLEKKKKDLQAMQEDLERKAAVMNDEAKRTKARELQDKYTEFQRSTMEAENEMGMLRQQLQDDIAEKLKKVCATLAQQQGYTLVVEKSVAWYSLPSYDITPQLIKAYNAQPKAPKK